MSHNINVVIGDRVAIAAAASRLDALWVELTLALIPMTLELFAQLSSGDDCIGPFETLTPSVLSQLRAQLDVFGYLETEYFGGVGHQCAGAWNREVVAIPPVQADDAVNKVLRALGVMREGGRDEWDTVGLTRFRDVDDLLDAAVG